MNKETSNEAAETGAAELWLPPASELSTYPPGFQQFVIEMAKEQQRHRHELELKELEGNISLSRQELAIEKRGQTFALYIGIVAIVAGVILGWKGQQITASIIGGGGVIGLVSAFLRATRNPIAANTTPPDRADD